MKDDYIASKVAKMQMWQIVDLLEGYKELPTGKEIKEFVFEQTPFDLLRIAVKAYKQKTSPGKDFIFKCETD